MRTVFKAALLWLVFIAPAFAQTVTTLPNFAQRYSTNVSGDIRIVGNTVMTCSGAACNSTILDGTSATNLNNNNQTMVNLDVDASDAGLNGYNNSSSADFTLPPGATILKAYLYWYAEVSGATVTTQRGQVKLRTSAVSAYNLVTASSIYQQAAPAAGVGYVSVADVTSLLSQSSASFTVAGIATQSGSTDTYGGWSLVLVLADPAEPFRKLTVFDGLKAVGSGAPVTINLSLGANATPPSGTVSMRMGVVAGEGDRGTTGDALAVRSYATPGLAPNAYTTLANDSGATNNFFNSSITRLNANVAAKNPNYINNLGVDMDVFDVANAGNAVIQNSTNALDINLTSTGDVYLPSVVTTAVQLYVPNVQQDMVKTVTDLNGGDVLPGDVLEYTIAFSNTGGDYADAVTLADAIPANTTYVAGSMAITGPNAGAKDDAANSDQAEYLTSGCAPVAAPCVRARLGVGATGSVGGTINPQPQANSATSFRFRVQVDAAVIPGTLINNTASVSYTARTLGQSFTVSSPAAATTSGKANLRLTKTHSGDFTQGQSNAAYTIKVFNDGGVTTAPFTVTDTLPAGLGFVSGSGANWSCTAVGQTVSCANDNAAPLPLAGSSTLTLLVNVSPTAGSPLVNNASVTGGGENAATSGNNSASDSTTVAGAPNLTVAKIANATPWTTGQTGRTYTVTVGNSGTAPTTGTVTMVDTPPAGMTVTAIAGTGWTCTLATRTCTRSDALGAAQSYPAITVTVTAPLAAGVVDNVATVSGGGQLYTVDDSATRPTTITTSARDLTITKSHAANFFQGQVGATYTLTVTNVGSALTGTPTTTVTETPPAGMTISAMSGSGWTCVVLAGLCTRANDLASAASFEAITVTVNVADNAATPLINQASVAVVGELPAQMGNNTASDSTVIEPTIDLALAKSASSAAPQPGVPFSYTITIDNSGSIAASGVTVLDVLPGGVALNSASASQGSYNSGNGVWNVGAVAVGGSATLTLTVTAASAGAITNSAQVLAANERDRDSTPGNSVAGEDDQASASVTVTAAGGSGGAVSGTVYADANHNGQRDGGEAGSGATLYAKLVPAAPPSGPALQAVSVSAASGDYAFSNVAAGEYVIVIDDNATLADVTPSLPTGWLGTEMADGRRTLVVAGADVPNQNFGLWSGSKVSGRVFEDNGAGGGSANDGVQQGSEAGLARVAVRATDAGGTITQDATLTDGSGNYTLWLAAGAVRIVQSNLAAYVSVGGSAGTTAGSYTRASDSVAFTAAAGVAYSGVNFADVHDNALVADGRQSTAPGSAVFYAHRFTPGSGGSVGFDVSASAFAPTLYRDADCNGALDAGEPVLLPGAPLAAQAGMVLCVIVKDSVPANAPLGSTNVVTLTATFSYSGASPALQSTHTNTDATSVGGASALELGKSQSTPTALPGALISYTITYTNLGSSAMSSIRLRDATPAYTRFVSAACGPAALPAGISACSVTQQPAANAAGSIEWTLVGSLASAASGQVTFTVRVEQ